MIYIFLVFVTILLFNLKFYKKDFYTDYLSKNNTSIVNGIFIILVFFSHFHQYVLITNSIDLKFYRIVGLIGQLMVTTFLFFSGYGIYESYKKKGKEYINDFFKKRFIPTYRNWCIALILFVIINIIMKIDMTPRKILLAFIGWESIGNSNWYMFDIFILYIIFIITFKFFKNNKFKISAFTLLTILFLLFLHTHKDGYWYNTLMCFPLGMIYSYNKKKIDCIVQKSNKSYTFVLISLILLFTATFWVYNKVQMEMFLNIVSCILVLLISTILMKFELKSKILFWCGKNLFWIYILQRIPMIFFKGIINNIYLYFIICMIVTLILVLSVNIVKTRRIKI